MADIKISAIVEHLFWHRELWELPAHVTPTDHRSIHFEVWPTIEEKNGGPVDHPIKQKIYVIFYVHTYAPIDLLSLLTSVLRNSRGAQKNQIED